MKGDYLRLIDLIHMFNLSPDYALHDAQPNSAKGLPLPGFEHAAFKQGGFIHVTNKHDF